MFYLQKVIAVMENGDFREDVEKLKGVLAEQGICLQCFWIEELGLGEITVEHIIDAVWNANEKLSAQEREKTCLWFTDMVELIRVLRALGEPVLALLHEKNRISDLSAALYACEEPGELDGNYLDRVYRRYQRLPWEVLETQRCILRESTPEDVESFYEIYSEPSITLYTEGLYQEPEQEKQYIRDYIDRVYSFYDFGVWTVLKKDSGEIIGRAGISYREGYEEPELGFVIGKPWQRKGYAEEICRAILKYARTELEFSVIQAFVLPENAASLGLCQKLGMLPIGEEQISGRRYVRLRKTMPPEYTEPKPHAQRP